MSPATDPGPTVASDVWDVAVVGGGIAGSVAACRAAEKSARVVVLELADDPLGAGNTLLASGSLNAAGVSPFTEPAELVSRVLAHGRANPALAYSWATTCASAIRWLTDRGIAVTADETGHHWLGDGSTVAAAPNYVTSVGPAVVARLRDHLRTLGGALRCGTRVATMEHDPEQQQWRLHAEDDPSEPVTARTVILATGGFAANPELLTRYLGPSSTQAKLRGAETSRGDGLLLALDAGARAVNTEFAYGHLLAYGALNDDRLWPYPRLDEVLPEAILVDRAGRRFLDEGLGDVAATTALARHSDPLGATLVFGAATWETRGKIRHHPRLPPPNAAITSESDGLYAAGGASELAVALGIEGNGLNEEIDRFNAWQRGVGAPLDVHRTGGARPIEAPLYGLRVIPGLSFTMGGIQIDGHGAAVGFDDRPIPGLFAAGDAIGGLMGGLAGGYHGGLIQAIVTGLISGRSAANLARQCPQRRGRASM